MPILTPATSTIVVPATLGQAGGAPVAASIRFAARNGNRASAARALSAPRGSSPGPARRDRRAHGTEVELVISDRRRVVPQRVVGAHDGGALVHVRLQRPLEHVAGVEQHHAAAVTRPRAPQVGDVAAETGQGLDVAVQIVGADDRDRDERGARRRAGATVGGPRRRCNATTALPGKSRSYMMPACVCFGALWRWLS